MNFSIVTAREWMSVDNTVANNLDYSTLPTNIAIVEWIESKGQIEYNDRPSLREVFTDVIPYAPYFQQFIGLIAGITLAQAKKVQSDVVDIIAISKRQQPYSFLGYSWDAGDGQTDAMVQYLSVQTANYLFAPSQGLAADINAQVNDAFSFTASDVSMKVNGSITGTAPSFIYQGVVAPTKKALDDIEGAIRTITPPDAGFIIAKPQPIAVTAATINVSPSTGIGNMTWIPIGYTTAVTLSFAQFTALLSGIINRRKTLNANAATKRAEINALTTVAAVIAYDVTAGWSY